VVASGADNTADFRQTDANPLTGNVTITVPAGTTTIGSMLFDNGLDSGSPPSYGYTLSGGTINLSGVAAQPNICVNGSYTFDGYSWSGSYNQLTINSNLTGYWSTGTNDWSDGILFGSLGGPNSGTGTIILNGANDFGTSRVSIASGMVIANNPNALGNSTDAGTVYVNVRAGLQLGAGVGTPNQSFLLDGYGYDPAGVGPPAGQSPAGPGTGALENLAGNTFNYVTAPGHTITLGGIEGGSNSSIGNDNTSSPLTISGATGIQGTGNLWVLGAGDTNISAPLSMTNAGIRKSGAGTLYLSTDNSANTFNGGTIIYQGVVNISNGNALGGINQGYGGVTVNQSGQLQIQGGITVPNALTIASEGTTANNNSTDTGGLRSISGANTWSGLVGITGPSPNNRIDCDNGTLLLSNTSAMPISGSSPVLYVGGGGNTTIDEPMGSSIFLYKDGAGTLFLPSTAQDVFARLTINNGTVNMQNAYGLATAGESVYVNSGGNLQIAVATASQTYSNSGKTLYLSSTGVNNNGGLEFTSSAGSNPTYSGAIALYQGNSRIDNDLAGSLLTLSSGTITGTSYTLTIGGAGNTSISKVIATGGLNKDGSGTLDLPSGTANTYNGPTNISNGYVNIQNAASLGNAAGTVTVTGTGELQLACTTSPTTYNSNPLILSSMGYVNTDGGLRVLSTAGANTIYPGQITLDGNSRIDNDHTQSGNYTPATTSGFWLNNANAITDQLGTSALTFGGAGATFWTTVVGQIQAYSLAKDGTGTLALASGPSTAGGNVTISGGALVVLVNGTSTAGPGGASGLGWTSAQVQNVLNNGTFNSTPTVDIDLTGGSWNDGGNVNVTNTKGFNLMVNELAAAAATNTLTLTGANNYTGTTTITKGQVNLQNGGALGPLGTSQTSNGVSVGASSSATLQLQNGITVNKYLSLGGQGAVSYGSLTGDSAIYCGGLQNLSGSNTWSGPITETTTAAFGCTAGTLALSGSTATFGSTTHFFGAGNISIADNISGSGTIDVSMISSTGQSGGLGTVAVSGTNTWTGAVNVYAGALNLNGASALSTGTNTVTVNGQSYASNDWGAVQVQGGASVARPLSLRSAGVNNDGGLRNISGNNTWSGLITLGSASRINSDSGLLTISNAGNITGAYNLRVGGLGNTLIASNLDIGAGTLTKDGTGTLTLSGTGSTMTGSITVSNGMLEATNAGALPGYSSSGQLSISNGATLAVNVGGASDWTATQVIGLLGNSGAFTTGATLGFDTTNSTSGPFTYGTAIGNAGLAVEKLGPNRLILSGANTYSGLTIVSGGTLELGVNAQAPVLGLGAAGADIQSPTAKLIFDYVGGSDPYSTIHALLNSQIYASGAGVNPLVCLDNTTADTVTVEATIAGDANLDGQVDINDLTVVLTNYNQSVGMSWSTGDFIGDGKVDINDLTIVLTNYNTSVSSSAAGSSAAGVTTAVPEPCMLALLAAGLAGLLAYVWRKRK
jgi:autotransporter-associated beta strand protein